MTPEEVIALTSDKNKLVIEVQCAFAKARKIAHDAALIEKTLADHYRAAGEHEAVLSHMISAGSLYVDAQMYEEAQQCYLVAGQAADKPMHETIFALMGRAMTAKSLHA